MASMALVIGLLRKRQFIKGIARVQTRRAEIIIKDQKARIRGLLDR
jgi:hypothetical protein